MRVFVDADVFIAALQSEPDRGDIAKALLNSEHQLSTSMAVLMEIRTVLAKKKTQPKERVASALDTIQDKLDRFIQTIPDLSIIDRLQESTLLYPMDCIHYTTALQNEMVMASFDSELQENGAYSPSELI